jgi:hypothetical protein
MHLVAVKIPENYQDKECPQPALIFSFKYKKDAQAFFYQVCDEGYQATISEHVKDSDVKPARH